MLTVRTMDLEKDSSIPNAVSSGIFVVVVDGNYSMLKELGFSLPALAYMQGTKVHLRRACWDIKKSFSGFSVSFFWPATKVHSDIKSKKRRRRRKARKQCKPTSETILACFADPDMRLLSKL